MTAAFGVAIGLATIVAGGRMLLLHSPVTPSPDGVVPPATITEPTPTTGALTSRTIRGHAAGRRPAAASRLNDPATDWTARPSSRDPVVAPPTRIAFHGLRRSAPVQPVVVRADGAVDIPADAATVGWVASTAVPGSTAGTAALVGHLDDRQGRLGVLAALATMRIGSRVVVSGADGSRHPYVVRARRVYDKTRLPSEVFNPAGRPRLALITCTGPYDHREQAYPANLVVYAVPAHA